MSVQTPEGTPEPTQGASFLGPANEVMANIFDVVGSEEDSEESSIEEGSPAVGAEAAPAGDQPAGEAPTEPAVSTATEGAVGAGDGVAASPPQPVRAPATAAGAGYSDQLSKVGEQLETRMTEHYRQEALIEYNNDYGHYIEQLQKHPLELVGQKLPPLSEDGADVTYTTAAEVREWQDAVKAVLGRGLQSRVEAMRVEDNEVLSVVHTSIELFQNNHDLIPGSTGFNKPLADQVARLVKPYELRLGEKLTGYSIDIQGIVDQARGQLTTAPAATPPAPVKKAGAKKAAAPPQGGIASKAGTSGPEGEDFTPMWNALGIPSIPI